MHVPLVRVACFYGASALASRCFGRLLRSLAVVEFSIQQVNMRAASSSQAQPRRWPLSHNDALRHKLTTVRTAVDGSGRKCYRPLRRAFL